MAKLSSQIWSRLRGGGLEISGSILLPIRAALPTSGPRVQRSAGGTIRRRPPGRSEERLKGHRKHPSGPRLLGGQSPLELGLAVSFLPAAILKMPPLCLWPSALRVPTWGSHHLPWAREPRLTLPTSPGWRRLRTASGLDKVWEK